MSTEDPIRLSALVDQPTLSELLQSAQNRLPDDLMVARLAGRLGLGSPGGAGGGPMEPRPSGPPATPLVAVAKVKALAAVAALAGTGLVAVALLRSGNGDGRTPSAVSQPSTALSTIAAPSVAPAAPEPVTVPSAAVSSEAPVHPAPATLPSGAVSRLPAAPVVRPSETELIGDARRALLGDPSRALQLSTEHARLYPRGALGEEREVIAIEALVALGRKAEARARARAFMTSSPGTPYVQRIARAVGSAEADDSVAPPAHDEKSIAPPKKTP